MLSSILQTAAMAAIAYDGVHYRFANTTALYNKVSDTIKLVWNSELLSELCIACKPIVETTIDTSSRLITMVTESLKEHNNQAREV